MPRWDDEKLDWKLNEYPNAPCHTCVYRDKDGANRSCTKYSIPRYSIGFRGKPDGVLNGTSPCGYYKAATGD